MSSFSSFMKLSVMAGMVRAALDSLSGKAALLINGKQIIASDLVRRPLISTVTWTGNGTSQQIPCPFVPEGLIVIASGKYSVFCHRYTWRQRTPYLAIAQPHVLSGGISFDAGSSFTVGSHSSVNSNGVTYTALVLSDNGSGTIKFGSHSGDGVDGREIDYPGAQGVFVIIKRDNTYTSQIRFDSGTQGLQGDNSTPTNNVTAFSANGFLITNDASVNSQVTGAETGGEAYDSIVFLPSPYWTCFSYAASGTAGQKVQLPFYAVGALIKSTDSVTPQNMLAMVGGISKNSMNGTTVADAVIAVSDTGLTLGTNAMVNAAGKVYNGIAFAQTMTPGAYLDAKITPPGLQVTAAASAGVLVPYNTAFDRNSPNPFTLELYLTPDQSAATDCYLLTQSTHSSDISWGIYWNAINLQFEFVAHESGGNRSLFSTSVKPKSADPIHIILTFDGTSKFRFAVDGKVVKVMNTAYALTSNASARLTIGGKAKAGVLSETGSAVGFKFYLARFYQSVLTDAQISNRFRRCALGDFSVLDVSPTEEWDCSRVVGSTLFASKSAANNGTISNCIIV